MINPHAPSPSIVAGPFEGEVKILRIRYSNDDTGFRTFLGILKNGGSIAIAGVSSTLTEGESVHVKGTVTEDPKWGLQIKAKSISPGQLSSKSALRNFLASGLFKGVGEAIAFKIVETFGMELDTVVKENPEALISIPGISKSRMELFCDTWKEQGVLRNLSFFLYKYDIDSNLLLRIYKEYKGNSIQKLNKNPYQLANDIHGFGFKKSDEIARCMGIEPDSPFRIKAGLVHAIKEHSRNGHCFSYTRHLITRTAAILNVERSLIEGEIGNAIEDGDLVMDVEVSTGKEVIMLSKVWRDENIVANTIKRLAANSNIIPADVLKKQIKTITEQSEYPLSNEQENAVIGCLQSGASIITGGPGVGKTRVIEIIVKLLYMNKITDIKLVAPTGKAAECMSESTGDEGITIHRLLEYNPHYGFQKNSADKLEADVIICDEASMLDISLAARLLEAVRGGAIVIFVGDEDQLESVEPGRVLADMINSKIIPVFRLTEIWRQKKGSKIIENSHKVKKGLTNLSFDKGVGGDCYFFPAATDEDISSTINDIVSNKLPNLFGIPSNEIMVLSPQYKSPAGVTALNKSLQETLNPDGTSVVRFNTTYRDGDPVIQTRNDYDRGVFNGSTGEIRGITEDDGLIVDFGGEWQEYKHSEIDIMDIAYSMSIHKSQGSGFRAVIISVSKTHSFSIERKSIYTAMTRPKEVLIFVGDTRTLAAGIKRKISTKRMTLLKQRLMSAA